MIGHQNQFEWTNSPPKIAKPTSKLVVKKMFLYLADHCHVFLHQLFVFFGDLTAKVTGKQLLQRSPRSPTIVSHVKWEAIRCWKKHVQKMRVANHHQQGMLGKQLGPMDLNAQFKEIANFRLLCISYNRMNSKLAHHITPLNLRLISNLFLKHCLCQNSSPKDKHLWPCLVKFLFVPGTKNQLYQSHSIYPLCFWDKLEHLEKRLVLRHQTKTLHIKTLRC